MQTNDTEEREIVRELLAARAVDEARLRRTLSKVQVKAYFYVDANGRKVLKMRPIYNEFLKMKKEFENNQRLTAVVDILESKPDAWVRFIHE